MGHDRGLGALAADDLPGTVFGHQHGLALGAAHHQRLAGPEPGDAAVHAAQLGQREAIAACNGGARLAAAHTVHQCAQNSITTGFRPMNWPRFTAVPDDVQLVLTFGP